MRGSIKGRRARHVIVIAGASGSGKTELIKKLSRTPLDEFSLSVLNHLGCDPNQRLKRSTVERMQRLMDPANYKKRKTRKLQHCLLLHIDLTSINHNNNLKLLRETRNEPNGSMRSPFTPHRKNGDNASLIGSTRRMNHR